MIISRTPFRISFFGGGTDYPVWYSEHGGAVLATSIDKYCYISRRRLPPFSDRESRISYSKNELLRQREKFQHPSARETLKFMGVDEGIEIHHDADLPARTGLGSSSSFTVGLLHTLYALRRRMPTKMQLAEESIHIERDLVKESVGSQDQVTASFGGFNRISFSADSRIALQPILIGREKLELLQSHLMLYFTGFSRFASAIAEKQIRDTHKKKIELKALFDMVDRSLEILTSGEDLAEFGKLLHESWLVKRSLTDKITTSQIDEIYTAAREAGCLGGKLLGAGGGGFMLLFARPEDQPRIRQKLKRLLHVPFRFENGGSQIISYDHDLYDGEFSRRREAFSRDHS